MSAEVMSELQHGRLYRFRNWPISDVPTEPGVYTVWNDACEFLYVGMATSSGPSKGLRSRLGSHANGGRGADRFNVYIADRFVLKMLTKEQIADISEDKIRFDELVKRYNRKHLSFRFCRCPKTDTKYIEDLLKEGRWPHGRKPVLNPS